MKRTLKDINKSLTKMFNEHSFVNNYRKSVRKSFMFYLKKK